MLLTRSSARARPWRLGAAAWLALACLSRTAAPGEGPPQWRETSIEVAEAHGLARRGWPIGVGVPFPRGAVAEVDGLRLLAESGAALPTQSRVLSRWPDGSVRWALVDWQVDLAPRQRRRFRLRGGPPPPARPALVVVDGATAVAVDTGRLRFSIPKRRFAVLDEVRLAGRAAAAGPLTAVMEVEGARYPAQAPATVRVLESGPLRARIELRGVYGADFHYVIRVDAFAGQPFVRVLHSFEQRGPRAESAVGRIAVEMPLRLQAPRYRVGREGHAPLGGALSAERVAIVQEDNAVLRLDGAVQAGRTAGWVEVSDAARGVAVAGRFVWQEYPQSVHLSAAELRYNLWAPEAAPAAIGMGAAKTHEWVVSFHDRTAPAPAWLDALAEPLLGWVDATQVAASGALPNSIAPGADTTAFLAALAAGFARYQATADGEAWDDGGSPRCDPARERRRRGFYGMLNWGDWNFPGYHDMVNGCDTWGNLEYDDTQVLALAYAATGDPALHVAMTAAARHYMDVDRVHADGPPCDCRGMNHPRTARHFSFDPVGVDLGYTWTEGLLSYYALTGDERALAAARGIADHLVRSLPAPTASAAPRQWGWPAIALLAVADATGEPRYAEAAAAYARRGMAAYPPTSGRDFGIGTLADALAYLHAQSGDPALRDWLTAHAAAVMASPRGADPRYFPAVAYVGALDGDAGYRRAASDAVARQTFGDWAKPFTLAGRTGFRILSLLQRPAVR